MPSRRRENTQPVVLLSSLFSSLGCYSSPPSVDRSVVEERWIIDQLAAEKQRSEIQWRNVGFFQFVNLIPPTRTSSALINAQRILPITVLKSGPGPQIFIPQIFIPFEPAGCLPRGLYTDPRTTHALFAHRPPRFVPRLFQRLSF